MLEHAIEVARKDLLDLSARNRLLNTEREKDRSSRLDIVDELADQVFRILVNQKKTMTFLPTSKDGEYYLQNDSWDPYQSDQAELAKRHIDNKLQTNLGSKSLQKRLLKFYYDSKTLEEEQGVNTLFIAIGFLKYRESKSSSVVRQAPLILVPVKLERSSAGSQFKVSWNENEISTNLSLQEKLISEFQVCIPDIDETEDFKPSQYIERIRNEISGQKDWDIDQNGMVMWFFSFAKFLMYKDLDVKCWPQERSLKENTVVGGLLGGGFKKDPPLFTDEQKIDQALDPLTQIHVLNADSSQSIAIEEVKNNRNLVIQGPPGTGKSQTIANIIASAVHQGKRVLFVAEKMAALEVVHRRMKNVDLGPLCLELHSNKANKKEVLNELAATMAIGRPKLDDNRRHVDELIKSRDKLNEYVEQMHSRLSPSELTPFQLIGTLVSLHQIGIIKTDFDLPGAENWTPEKYMEILGLIKDLANHLKTVGNPTTHPWHGVNAQSFLPSDRENIRLQIDGIQGKIRQIQFASETIAEAYGIAAPQTLAATVSFANLARCASISPDSVGETCICSSVWDSNSHETLALVDKAKKCRDKYKSMQPSVTESAWETDWTATQMHLRTYGRSIFRFFSRRYRQANALLASIVKTEVPKKVGDRIKLVDDLIAVQKTRRSLEDQRELGRQAFGKRWDGEQSDFDLIDTVIQWQLQLLEQHELPQDFRRAVYRLKDKKPVVEAINVIRSTINEVDKSLKLLFATLKIHVPELFSISSYRDVKFCELISRLDLWGDNDSKLVDWINFRFRLNALQSTGLTQLSDRVFEGKLGYSDLEHAFKARYYEQLIRLAFTQFPTLAQFSGISHGETLQRFRNLDFERESFARQQVANRHFESLPNHGSESGEVGILNHEINKKRNHKPIRKLLSEAGTAIQMIKPVFMMSPMSVAQFLEPGKIDFDLLIIDEASQVKPVDAIGAMARAKQVVVVGDDKQLPPTDFFNKVTTGDDDVEASDDFNAKDIESILGLCLAQNINQRMLRWHYRSLHHSLIAVSNQEFYDGRLFIVPNPKKNSPKLGLSLVHVKNGCYDRGSSRTNRVEAETVANAVIEHAKIHPDKSLGVAAFSTAQRDAILDELELRRRENPGLEKFFIGGGPEPFFVKNIENVQGDERDAIMISVGYAPDKDGHMTMSFGPLQTEGGERRLNVLITRAKERCVVFTSILPADIDINRARSRGVKAFKTFLNYADSGILETAVQPSDRGFDSEFEASVAKAIGDLGFEVWPQIGEGTFFIDLAIVDPDHSGRFLLGIECDGAQYHSSLSARDRDRLRQDILENRGWIIHRIWSTDWFNNPKDQLQKVLEAIENAKLVWASRDSGIDSTQLPTEKKRTEPIKRESNLAASSSPKNSISVIPYKEAEYRVDWSEDFYDLPPEQLGRVVEAVVKVEGPVHRSEIARRLASFWGMTRTGSRITGKVYQAINYMTANGKLKESGDFCSMPHEEVQLRSREDVVSPYLRKPEMLPPDEVERAVFALVEVNVGIELSELMKEAAQLFGFRSSSAKLKAIIDSAVKSLIQKGIIESRNDKYYVVVVAAEIGNSV